MYQTKSERLRLELPSDGFDVALNLTGALLLAAFLVVVAASWSSLPEQVPLHFALNGQPDGWGSRGGILVLPGVALALFILLSVLARFPHLHNYSMRITPENAERQYRLARRLLHVLKLLIVVLFFAIYLGSWGVAAGRFDGLPGILIWLPLAAIFLMIGWYMLQSRRAR